MLGSSPFTGLGHPLNHPSPEHRLSNRSRFIVSQANIKRRTALVDPEVQGGVLKKIAVHWVVFFVCNAVALTIWIRLFEQPDAGWGQTFSDTLKRFLPFFIISLALIPAFTWDTLKLTNRFAGPILRLRATLAEASRGDAVEPLHFRTNDYWQEIATNFNTMLSRNGVPMQTATDNDSDPSDKV